MPERQTDQTLRAAIDGGITGEKVAFPDPAAAPLGTDAEAGGEPTVSQPVSHEPQDPKPASWSGLWIYAAAVGAVLIIALLIVALNR